MKKKSSGVTLIELLVVAVILGIIAAIAFPSYQESARKSRRAEAKVLLMSAAQLMERYYTENGRYWDGVNCGISARLPMTPPDSNNYQLAAAGCVATASTFTLTVAPQGKQTGDACGSYTLTNTGTRGVTGSLGVSSCW